MDGWTDGWMREFYVIFASKCLQKEDENSCLTKALEAQPQTGMEPGLRTWVAWCTTIKLTDQ